MFQSAYERERLALGSEIRSWRKRKGLTGVELAAKARVSQSKISKIENGFVLPTNEDITRIAAALTVQQSHLVPLMEQLRGLRTEVNSWRLLHRRGFAQKQLDVAAIEAQTRATRLLQISVVPGLLQIADYARQVMTMANVTSQRDVEEAVASRIARQRVLYDQGRTFEFLILEQALWSRFSDAVTVVKQIDRLRILSDLSNIKIGLLPMDIWLPTIPQNSFCIYDNTLVTVESLTAEISITDERDVKQYNKLFETLAAVALYRDDADKLLSSCRLSLLTEACQ